MSVPVERIEKLSRWMRVLPKLGLTIMDHLYNKMNAIYMVRWRSNFPDQASIESWRMAWADEFEKRDLTLEQIGLGIDRSREAFPAFPPSLWEFIALCKQVTPACHRNFQPAITQKEDPAKRRANIAQFRADAARLFKQKEMK